MTDQSFLRLKQIPFIFTLVHF